MTERSIWEYSDEIGRSDVDLVGFDVEALDGSIGAIDAASDAADDAHLVVDTGGWIFGKKRLIPAGVVSSIDVEARTVRVNLSRDQIKSAPDWNSQLTNDEWHPHHERYLSSIGFQPGGV